MLKSNLSISMLEESSKKIIYKSSKNSNKFFLDFAITNPESLIEYLRYHNFTTIIIDYLYNFDMISLPNIITNIQFNNLSSFNNPLNNDCKRSL